MSESIFHFLTAIIVMHGTFNIAFLAGLMRVKASANQKGRRNPVSVVIAARNEESNLKMLIPELLNQNHPDFEIIVAINNSTDHSYDYLLSVQKQYPQIKPLLVKHIPEDWNSKKYALTKGIEAASNNIIVLTDADCVPSSPSWLSVLDNTYNEDTTIVLGYSPYFIKKGILNGLIRCETIFTAVQYMGAAMLGFPYMGVGRNLSYSKAFFKQVGGFEEVKSVTGGDDDLFVNRFANGGNTRVSLTPISITSSEPKKKWRDYIQQKTRHFAAGKKYSLKSKIFLGAYMFSFLGAWLGFLFAIIFLSLPMFLLFTFCTTPLALCFAVVNAKSASAFPIYQHLLLNTIYPFFHIFVGLRSLLTRRIEWTN